MASFKEDNYIIVPGFAIVKLGLSGNELLCYSLIYGFSQDGETEFKGSLSYLSSALNVTKANAKAILDRLIGKGLIIKREEVVNGVKFCRYSCNNKGIIETITPPIIETITGGVIETITDNIDIDNTNTDNDIKDDELFPNEDKGQKKPRGTSDVRECLFVNSRFYDFEAFRAAFAKDPKYAGADIEFYYERIKNWSAANGKKKKKDWISFTRNWMLSDYQEGKLKKASAPFGSSLSQEDLEELKNYANL